jgi:hypothetical protein
VGFFLCGACQRHVRRDEAACPFCGGRDFEPTPRAGGRLSRSAMIGAAAFALACGGTTPGDDGGTDGNPDDVIQAVDAAYGGPPFDAMPDQAVDAPPDGPIAAYGGPPQDGGTG